MGNPKVVGSNMAGNPSGRAHQTDEDGGIKVMTCEVDVHYCPNYVKRGLTPGSVY
jgi:hypothetical protein